MKSPEFFLSFTDKNKRRCGILGLALLASCAGDDVGEPHVVTEGAIYEEVTTLYPEAENIRATGGENYGIGGAAIWELPDGQTCTALVIRDAHKLSGGNVLATEPFCRQTISEN